MSVFLLVFSVLSQECKNINFEGLDHYYQTVSVDRTVIIGDLHGDFNALLNILQFTRTTNEDLIVSIGDTIGRGDQTKEILDFFMKTTNTLHLIGNHEHLNLILQFSYVSDGDFQSFGGEEKRRQAFAMGGKYWEYIVSRPLVVKLGDVLLVHAGLSSSFLHSVDDVEKLTIKNLKFHEIYTENSPIWYRGYAQKAEWQVCQELFQVLRSTQCEFMVMGHTVFDKIITKCHGKAIFIDTGISYVMRGYPSALEVLQTNGKTLSIRAVYPDNDKLIFSHWK